jgi:hypothetical protein
MKSSSYGKVVLVALALAGAQSSSAAVLAGFFAFDGNKSYYPIPPTDFADELAPGFAGWIESPDQASQGSGGDGHGFYGTSGIPVPPGAPIWGDGTATIRTFSSGSSVLKFSLTNNTGFVVQLSDVFFEAAASTGQTGRFVQVDFINAMGTTPLGIFGAPVVGLVATSGVDFDDFGINLGNYMMANSETVSFVFTNAPGSPLGTTIWIDDLAVVPEPSSLMAFGCMLMTGLMFRSRRR